MIYVSDKFTMFVGEEYHLSNSVTVTVKNNSDSAIKLYGKNRDSEYTLLETIQATSSKVIDLTTKFLKIVSSDNTAILYVTSQLPNHTNPSKGNGTGIPITRIETIENKLKEIQGHVSQNTPNQERFWLSYLADFDSPDIPDSVTEVEITETGAIFTIVDESEVNKVSREEKAILYRKSSNNRWFKLVVKNTLYLGHVYPSLVDEQGIYRNTRFLLNAFSVASKHNLNIQFPKNSHWVITKPIFIDRNIKDIDGNGSLIEFNTGSGTGGFITTNEDTGNSSGLVSGGFKLHHFTIQPHSTTDTAVYGFYGRNTSYVEISDCTIHTTHNEPILFLIQPDKLQVQKQANLLYNNSTGFNKVLRCNITYNKLGDYDANGIIFNVDMRTITGVQNGNVLGMSAWIKAQGDTFNGTFPDPLAYHENIQVIDCTVDGSRYGIAGYYVRHGLFKGNTCKNNTRGLVIQNTSRNVQIVNNRVFDNKSSALLVNYGCTNNTIAHNLLESNKAVGQAFLHSSIFCSNNIFKENIVRFTKETNNANEFPMWGIYLGVACQNVIFENNFIQGKFRKACLAIESDWQKGDSHTESFGSTMASTDSTVPDRWASNVQTKDITIKGNTLIQHGEAYTAVYLRSLGNTLLTGVTFINNTVQAVNGMRLRMLGAKKLTTGNNNYDTDKASKYAIGNKADYVTILNDYGRPKATWEQTSTATTTVNKLFELTVTSNKDFTAPTVDNAVVFLSIENQNVLSGLKGGYRGQVISVRWVSGIVLEHTTSLRLINDSPSSRSLNSNMISSFMCLAPNVWTETTRNFS